MKYLFPFILLVMVRAYCPAQTSLPDELRFNFLDVNGGLPEGLVLSMLQDRQGYIWMTTQRGLVRYDGYKPKVYTLGIADPYRMFVIKVYQDRKGRIWAGTWYGDLFLYDPGIDSFILYPLVSKSSGSAPDLIAAVMQDDSLGRLWITMFNQTAQHSSIVLFDPTTAKITRYGRQETGKNHIDADLSAVYQDRKGRIWMTGSNGLYEFDNKNERFIHHLAATDSGRQKGFTGIIEDVSQPGLLWLTNAFYVFGISSTTDKGLWRFSTVDDSGAVYYHSPGDANSIASDTVLKVMNDAKGNLWVGTMSGLSLFDRGNNKFINYYPAEKRSGDRNAVIDIVQDKSGNFWCQTGMGILYFDIQTRKFTRITADPKKADGLLSNDLLHTFVLDKHGTLWLGVGSGGVQWINRQPSGFIQYDINQEGSHNFPGGEVQGFAKDAVNNIWIGARKGLYRWQTQTNSFTKIKFWKDKAVSESAASVPLVDKNGKIWFEGNWGNDNGLNCYDPQTRKTQYYRNIPNDTTSLSNNNVFALCEDHLGNIWVGTFGNGICRFNPATQKFTRYPFIRNAGANTQNHGALDDNWVLSIFEDKDGTIWVGTNAGGLNRFNAENGSFTSYQNIVPGFQSITGIYGDSQNRLWVGSYYGGVFLFDPKTGKAEKFTEKDGLLYDGANAILEDSSHNLWLTSARGISIFNTQTHLVRTLTTANGLPVNNLNNFRYGIKISNRKFLFSGDNGFTAIDPEEFKPDPNAPTVHIESVGFIVPGSKPTRDSIIFAVDEKNISLSYNENRLSFAYVGLHYQEGDLVRYAYQLEGYDKEWIPAGTQRTVTYINLSPGTYTFRVKAVNSSGVWSTENPSLTITIYPPWWQRWWAWLMYVVLFIAALWAFIAYRARHLKRTNQVLEEKVSHRTQQLNKSLDNLRATQSQLIQSEKMASLGELTAGIAHEIQNPLNFVNNFSELNNELIDEMNTELDNGDIHGAKAISKDIKQNLEKINLHGKRADAIVKGMLQHSRSSTGQKDLTDINALADEYLRLAYHGLRARDNTFNAAIITDFDNSIGKVNIVQQDIGRVLLNLYNNAFYAVNEKKIALGDSYDPVVSLTTKKNGDNVEIRVADNGNGITKKIVDKIFQPFFTTKPTGQGTGLGLSLSYDIIKAHGGEIKVNTKEGEETNFTIQLPIQ